MSLTFEQIYPAVYRHFTKDLERNMNLKFYPLQVNIMQDTGVTKPCIYMSSIDMPNETFCFDAANFKIIFNMSIADEAVKNDTIDSIADVLALYGRFVDLYDVQEFEIDIEGEKFIVKGDIIDVSPRLGMQADLVYGYKTCNFQYMYEFIRQGGE